ncbi:MAG: hypothetical protein COZ85_02505 [Candidatus Moranbacteria bacterium CG_4_8_14_3_um_filter_34_16]|nr:MAG: hypothetical protein COZ85_02505 [Candidatus Moranbacteria bacterium CG_4_8_14_3_um_filter_34_16]
MLRFLKNDNKTNTLIFFSFGLFFLSLILNSILKFHFPLYFSGFFLALFIPGLAIKNILAPKENWLTKIVSAPVFTIFFFTPFFYLITRLIDNRVNFSSAFFSLIIIALFSIIFSSHKIEDKIEDKNYSKFIFFGIGTFLLVHLATTLVYPFVPEIDGYAYIMNAQQNISAGIFNAPYRPMFAIFVDFVSLVSQISPYWLFKFGIIITQISGIYYLYQIIKIAEIKQKIIKYLILSSFASVPVINLEVDYIRPNVLFILAILPFIYYLSRGLDGKKKYFFFSSIIATTGLLIHEFFIILFLLNAFFVLNYFYQKLNASKKTLFWTIGGLIFFIMILHIKIFNFLLTPLQLTGNFIEMVQAGLRWNWWFLGGYSNIDGFNLGWTGFKDILNYYAYSISPFLSIIFLFYLFVLAKKIYFTEKFSSLEKIALAVLSIGLIFSEFLPRIDFKTLPDRFWPMTSMALITLAPFVLVKFKFFEKKSFQIVVAILIFIGIGGSIYIAKAKAGYISQREYKTSQWIKENTPENSLFITQGGNGPILNYFAKRENFSPSPSFFLPKNTLTENKNITQSEKFLSNINKLLNTSLTNPTDANLSALNSNLKAYYQEIKKEKLVKNIDDSEFALPKNENIYILYSFDKFNNYYANRKWWRDINFYGADLSKFNDTTEYELVYNDNNIIYIWKKK